METDASVDTCVQEAFDMLDKGFEEGLANLSLVWPSPEIRVIVSLSPLSYFDPGCLFRRHSRTPR